MSGFGPADGVSQGERGAPARPLPPPGEHEPATPGALPWIGAGDAGAEPLGVFRFSGEEETREPRRRLRMVRNLTLAVLAVVLLVLAVVFGPTAWRIARERTTSLTTPAQVAGLTVDDSANARETADYLRTAVAAEIPLRTTVGAVYTDQGGEPRSVIFVGGTGLLLAPEKNLDATFTLVSDENGGVDDARPVPAGPLGGVMKCGTTLTDDATMTVCGWADHGCLGVAMFPNRGVDESARLLLAMRNAMQRRG
jgi:hypothetical protein